MSPSVSLAKASVIFSSSPCLYSKSVRSASAVDVVRVHVRPSKYAAALDDDAHGLQEETANSSQRRAKRAGQRW